MYDDPEAPHRGLPSPPPALRERVLSACRHELVARRQSERLRQARWRWSVAAAVLGLLLLNAAEEQRSAARIARLLAAPSKIVRAQPRGPAAGGALRARATFLAALLRDPNAL